MDLAKWWNTKGQLGRLGTMALRRGFPRTHRFAQARSVFAVASHRCSEVFDPPVSVTLWRLPEPLEEAFDARWEYWIDNASDWTATFERVEAFTGTDLVSAFRDFNLISDADLGALCKLRRTAEGRAVQVPGMFSGSTSDVTLLALGFARAEIGELSVPYMSHSNA